MAESSTRERRGPGALAWRADLEDFYRLVRLWWVEIGERGVPQREIGFDSTGKPIVAGPVGRNKGFWTDSPMIFKEGEYPPIAPVLFEEAWLKMEAHTV